LRLAEAGESLEDKRSKLAEGFRAHYEEMASRAEEVRGGLAIPVVATGHCFAAGGVIQEGDGVRDLSVGSLDYIEASLFSGCFDYVALGHLHVPQKVAGSDVIRYSGSPIPMGFGEASHQKRVLEVEFEGRSPTVNEIAVPCFQPLRRIAGTVDELLLAVAGLKEEGSNAWLEIEYSGEAIVPDLRDQLEAAIEGSELEICRIKNRRVMNRVLQQIDCAETLDDLEPSEVFTRCLTAHEIPAEQQVELRAAYQEILRTVLEADPCAG
jgi:DNA repair protein SbcD/Mre11